METVNAGQFVSGSFIVRRGLDLRTFRRAPVHCMQASVIRRAVLKDFKSGVSWQWQFATSRPSCGQAISKLVGVSYQVLSHERSGGRERKEDIQ